jgi:cell division protein FtsB
MNANELADELQELDSKLHLISLFKAATMLRQQQAEIEALKAEKEKLFMGMLDMALDAEIKDLKNGN